MLPDRTSQGRREQFGDGDGGWPKSRSWSPVWVNFDRDAASNMSAMSAAPQKRK
jgi:hypothetical protein